MSENSELRSKLFYLSSTASYQVKPAALIWFEIVLSVKHLHDWAVLNKKIVGSSFHFFSKGADLKLNHFYCYCNGYFIIL